MMLFDDVIMILPTYLLGKLQTTTTLCNSLKLKKNLHLLQENICVGLKTSNRIIHLVFCKIIKHEIENHTRLLI